MYIVKLNNDFLSGFGEFHRPDYEIFDAKLETNVNDIGHFFFTVYDTHPLYSQVDLPKQIITVLKHGQNEPLFIGRVAEYSMGMYNQKIITCESEMSFLLDTVRTDFTAPDGRTADARLIELIKRHNGELGNYGTVCSSNVFRKFAVGKVSDSLASNVVEVNSEEFEGTYTTYDIIMKLLVEKYGGILKFRHENNTNYIDWIAEDELDVTAQKIEFGSNIIDISKNKTIDEIVTAVRPVGDANESDPDSKPVTVRGFDAQPYISNTDISQVIDEKISEDSSLRFTDCLYSDHLVRKYGWIQREIYFENISQNSQRGILVQKAQKYLESMLTAFEITLTALNLSAVGMSIQDFNAGDMITVNSQYHGIINQKFIVCSAVINFSDPSDSKLTLGIKNNKSITSQVSGTASSSVGVRVIDSTGGTGISGGSVLYSGGRGIAIEGYSIKHTNSLPASTIGSGSASIEQLDYGSTFDMPWASYDECGHITASGSRKIRIPDKSEKVYTANGGIKITDNNFSHTNTISAGTIGDSNSNSVLLDYGKSFNVPWSTYDENGHITSSGNTTFFMPQAVPSADYTAGDGIEITENDVIRHTNSLPASTIGSGSASIEQLDYGSTFDMPWASFDECGHITASGSRKMRMPDKNTYSAGKGISVSSNVISSTLCTDITSSSVNLNSYILSSSDPCRRIYNCPTQKTLSNQPSDVASNSPFFMIVDRIATSTPVTSQQNVSMTTSNIASYFTVENSSYYFAGSGSVWTSNNNGVNSSTAQTVLTAKRDMTVSFSYSYSSETNYDKFYLTVGGTTVLNGVSGSTTSGTYSKAITSGQTIIFKYTKDGSAHSNNDKCTFSNMNVTFTDTTLAELQRQTFTSAMTKKTYERFYQKTGSSVTTWSTWSEMGSGGGGSTAVTLVSSSSSSGTSNASASNGSVRLNLVQDGTVKNSHLIKGTGDTTVTSDSSGNITINSTSDALPLSGGTMNAGSEVVFKNSANTIKSTMRGVGLKITPVSSGANIASGISWTDTDGTTVLAAVGCYYKNGVPQYIYFGKSYNDYKYKIDLV